MNPVTTHNRGSIFVVLLGPDGCGKSTIANQLISRLRNSNYKVHHFHWRPGLLPQLRRKRSEDLSTNPAPPPPPDKFAYGYLVSLVRYIYYLADFVLGYWIIIWPRRKRGQIIICERWYLDVLIHPARYGFRLPAWLLSLGGRLIPWPDITFLLEADPIAIHRRKPELTIQQIDDQLTNMRKVLPPSPRGYRISTDGSVDVSVNNILALMKIPIGINLPNHSHRTEKHFKAFPTLKNTRVWIDEDDRARNALKLYQPYSFFGQAIKTLFSMPHMDACKYFLESSNGSSVEDQLNMLSGIIRGRLNDPSAHVSFYMGTPGVHHKITAQASLKNNEYVYIKISDAPAVKDILRREECVLNRINHDVDIKGHVPSVVLNDTSNSTHMLFLSGPSGITKKRNILPDEHDLLFLRSLAQISRNRIGLDYFLNNIHANYQDSHSISCIDEMKAFLTKQWPGAQVITNFSHGDYAPWNTLWSDSGLFVFDWEYASDNRSSLYDLFHRIYMPDWLVQKRSPDDAIDHIRSLCNDPIIDRYISDIGITGNMLDMYICLYLLQLADWKSITDPIIPSHLQACMAILTL